MSIGKTALIGYTGFVGGNIAKQYQFTDSYNSQNIEEIRGQTYDLVVSSGTRAEKWRINQNPETDLADILKLEDSLEKVKAKKLVLISTVDVYPLPMGVDETTRIDTTTVTPYGRHRLELERFCRERFDTLTLRLPGLFGDGLKKNIIYDFLHNNQIENIHADSRYQFYWLGHIWENIQTALEHNLTLLNVATEPVSVAEVAKTGFGKTFDQRPAGVKPVSYDFKSNYAELFGGRDGYLYGKTQVLSEIHSFVQAERTA